MRKLPLPRPPAARSLYTPFAGGLDTNTPSISVPAGRCSDAINFEISVEDGYADIAGYERFDGRTKPADASYRTMAYTLTGTIAVGNVITGVTSGATATVIAIVTGYLVITKITGDFVAAETLNVSGSPQGTVTAAAVVHGTDSQLLHGQYLNLAADVYRALITAVPGEGSILGGWSLGTVRYAVRNAVGGATAAVYKSTASGWSLVALGRSIAFTSGGTYEMAVGNTITGATSGATAVITGVIVRTGTFAGGDAVGTITFASQTGTFQAENLNVGANLNVATIAGNSAAITLLPSGRYVTVKHAFQSIGSDRVFGCDGVNKGFSFDGTTWIPITTGMTVDTPDHCVIHSKHLFFSFDGVSQHSSLGFPYAWAVVTGASALDLGAPVTGYMVEPGSDGGASLLIASKNELWILYGNSSADWNLVRYREQVGARAYTIQQVGQSLMLDDIGLINFRTTQAYGNFQHAALTQHIRTWLNPKRANAIASCTVRDKNQYRLFFSDGYALYVTLAGKGKIAGAMPEYFPNPVTCTWGGETATGDEELFFGSTNGMVYQMERGTSFDGDSIDGYFTLHPMRQNALQWVKGYHAWVMESSAEGYAEWSVGYVLDYGTTLRAQPDMPQTEIGDFAVATRWDAPGATWDANLHWDGMAVQPSSSIDIRGSGENLVLSVNKSSDYFVSVLHSGGSIRYTLRRLKA